MPPARIAPSLLAADFACLGQEAHRMAGCGADWLHCDVMDGHAVANLTFGPCVVAALRKAAPTAFLDCHLMVTHPAQYITPLAQAGASQFTFHVEATDDPANVAAAAKLAGLRVGLALAPGTPAEAAFPLVDEGLLDMVLVMTVTPGFGGQPFQASQLPKVAALRCRYPGLDIQVDGGLGPSTVDAAASAGANVIVAGTAVFGAPDPAAVIASLRKAVDDAQQQQPWKQATTGTAA